MNTDNPIIYDLNKTGALGAGLGFDYGIFTWIDSSSYSNIANHVGIRGNINYQRFMAGKDYYLGNGLYFNLSFLWWMGD